MSEQPLAGGTDATRGVVRVGDTVRRPPTPWSAAVRALLQHLGDVGFDGAPRWLDVDEQGRDVLGWVEGDVPLPPYPAWAMTEQALDDLGRLVRRFHEATAGFDPSGRPWADEWGDPRGGPVVCHDDLYPENVVFRDGRVVALLDLDMAAPGRPLWDVAIAAQEWAPLHAPGSRLQSDDALDAVRRTAVLAASYGLGPDDAEELLHVVDEERAASIAHVLACAAAGDPVWSAHVADGTYAQRTADDDAWLRASRDALLAELRSRCRA